MKSLQLAAITLLCGLVGGHSADAAPDQAPSLNTTYELLASRQFVDLTHTFGPQHPHWKGFGAEKVTVLYTIKKDGFHGPAVHPRRASGARTSTAGTFPRGPAHRRPD